MNDFRKLKVWQLSMEMARDTYRATRSFPAAEKYGLQSQMRRSSVSVPSNIAEGASRTSNNDFRRFLVIARGSAHELETQAILSEQLGYLDPSVAEGLQHVIWRCQAMLGKLIRSLE